jgi:hypothetical protein
MRCPGGRVSTPPLALALHGAKPLSAKGLHGHSDGGLQPTDRRHKHTIRRNFRRLNLVNVSIFSETLIFKASRLQGVLYPNKSNID